VQVTVRRGGQNGNPAPTFLLHIFGYDHADLSALSLAATSSLRFRRRRQGRASEADQAKLEEMHGGAEGRAAARMKLSGTR